MSERFKASGYPWRLHCGSKVIEQDLSGAVRRLGAERVVAVCSPSVASRTDVIDRAAAALDGALVGVYSGIENDSTYRSVAEATRVAQELRADLILAIGGGSVLVAARAVAIFLAESGSPFELMTQYPANGGRPVSPRLEAPKCPIINLPTTPTTAMNRAGTGLKNTDLDQRMEYFDPKTRPQAIFLDEETLAQTPLAVLRSTATTLFCSAIANVSRPASNPLVASSTNEAFSLAHDGYVALADDRADTACRMNLALAAFLQNRTEDDGRRLIGPTAFGGDYAVSTALHLFEPSIGQGEATCVLVPTAIRMAERFDETQTRKVAGALGLPTKSTPEETASTIADRLEEMFAANQMPTQLRTLALKRNDLAAIANETVKNFNATGGGAGSSPEVRVARSLALLEAAW